VSIDFIKPKEVVSQIVQHDVPDIIRDELKKNLKVRTTITFPQAFNDGCLSTEIIYDGEIINTETQTITKGSTMFSF